MSEVTPSRLHLPPMSALNSFVAAARHGSFSRAGQQVGLTQSAVSRQIALLEEWLQTPLFLRTGRRVSLTADGRAYAESIAPALDTIRATTARLSSKRRANELSIATLPSFGMRWLAPRLPRLTAEHPELIVSFAARTQAFNFADEPFDAAIHFGLPDWPRANHDFLFREESVPVCSPQWLTAHPVASALDLREATLLHQSTRPSAWTRWFETQNVDPPPAARQPSTSIEHFLMLAQAAAAGAGVALIPRFLIEPELTSGSLVVPIDRPLATEDAYWLVIPDGTNRPAIQMFRNWLQRETRAA